MKNACIFERQLPSFKKWLLSCSFTCMVATAELHAQSIQKLDDESMTKLEAILSNYVYNHAVTGIGVAVIYNGKVAYTGAAGFAKTEPSNVSFTTQTKSLLASISKTITGIMAMKMVNNGHLSLDATIDNYIPGYSGTQITIRHLLDHQSGIAHYDHCPQGYDGPFNSTESLDVVKGCLQCVVPPGSAKLYTTFGSTLLGVIIDKVGLAVYNKGYGQLFLEWIAQPAAISNLIPAHDNSISGLAQGHQSNGDAETSYWNDIGWKLPAGGFIATPHDLANYGAAVMNYTFLDSVTSNSMWVNQPTSGTPIVLCGEISNSSIGLSFFPSSSGNDLRISHSGSNQHGYSSLLYLYPKQRTGIVILINKDITGSMLSNIRSDIENIVLCTVNRNFTSEINWSGNWVYEASSKISAGNIVNTTGGAITYDAGSSVTLTPGFNAVYGTRFTALIDGCMGNIKPINQN